MEENAVTTLCIICCSSYSPKYEDELSFLRKHKQFNMFFQQLEQALASSSPIKSAKKSVGNFSGYSTESLLETLGSFKQTSMSVCSECLAFIVEAAEAKTETELIETHVLSLQLQLLGALKDLQVGMDRYNQQIFSVCDILKKSDAKCLEVRMGENDGAFDKNRKTRRRKVKMEQNVVILFREAVLSIAADLIVFAEGLNKRLNVDRSIDTNYGSGRPRRCKSSKNIETSTCQNNFTAKDLTDEVTKEEEMEPDVQCKIEVDIDDTNDDTISNFSEDDLEKSFHYEEDDNNNDVDFDNDKDDTDEENSDSEYGPPSQKLRMGNSAFSLEDLNMKDFTKFRQRLIRRTLRKERRVKSNVTCNTEEVGPDSYHLKLLKDYPIEYDKESGAAKIAGTLIYIKDDQESLECSLCGYRSKPQGKSSKKESYMDKAMWNHVMKHLKALQCPKCPKILSSLTYLRIHLKDHETENKRLVCDVCERPMASTHSLAAHKWTHMNEEEKQESERRGIKNPNLRPQGEFQCESCGKKFRRKDAHDSHQRVHLPKQHREKVTCERCGKLLYSSSLQLYHLKYACPGNLSLTPQRIPCDICNATFKTSVQKKKHIARMHDPAAASRPYTCDQCQKTFKTSDCLRYHRMTHKETQFFCSKGCGSSFRVKRYCARHEKACSSSPKVKGDNINEYNNFK